jgi:hypothetical protein
MADTPQPNPSPTERRIGRLVVSEPAGSRPEERIDWIHDVDLEQLLRDHRPGSHTGH